MIELRELTTGQLLTLFLRRRGWTQAQLTSALTRTADGVGPSAASWRWKLTRTMNDHAKLTERECVASATAMALPAPEAHLLLRAADVPPVDHEITARIRDAREELERNPWPCYVTTYRLTHVLAWNQALSAVYGIGSGPFGPDLNVGLDGGAYRPLSFAAMLLDRQGPFKQAHAIMQPEERTQLLRQQVAYLHSYWAPHQLFGAPQWMIDTLRELRSYDEFVAIERAQSFSSLDTATGALYDTLQFSIGPWRLLLDVHPMLLDPRLEVLSHVPANRDAAMALLAAANAAPQGEVI